MCVGTTVGENVIAFVYIFTSNGIIGVDKVETGIAKTLVSFTLKGFLSDI